TFDGSYPAEIRDVRKYARRRRPPETRSATHKAVCTKSRALRHRRCSRESVVRDDASAAPGDTSDALTDGARPATSDDSIAHAIANITTRQSMVTAPSPCVVAGA